MQTRPRTNLFLVGAAAADLLLAALHAAIVLVGPIGYLYFGAAELARLAAQGSAIPAILTLLIAFVLSAFGMYALSAAGMVRRLPFLTTVLIFVSAVYILRGLVLIPDLIRLAAGAGYPLR